MADDASVDWSLPFDAILTMAFGVTAAFFVWMAVNDIRNEKDANVISLEIFVALVVTIYFLLYLVNVCSKAYAKVVRSWQPSIKKVAPVSDPAVANEQDNDDPSVP